MRATQVVGALLLWSLFHYVTGSGVACRSGFFKCSLGNCIPRAWFCDFEEQCIDGSDENYCFIVDATPCPLGWFRCAENFRCVPSYWLCDGMKDCHDGSDENNCGKNESKIPEIAATKEKEEVAIKVKKYLKDPKFTAAKEMLISWFKQRRKSGSTIDKWGSQLHRVAVALYLADESIFSPGNATGQEISYELTIQLLRRLSKNKKMSSQELALYIHAMMVACMDPRDFYGENLVLELRRRTEARGNYTNPFQILVLCNAGDTMTSRDVDRVTVAYDSQHRPFWTDTQALASLALACLSSRPNLVTDERILKDMLQELKRRQFRNGTVDNARTTALVVQALQIHDSFKNNFDLDSALLILLDSVKNNVSLLNAYYTLPVLSNKSLLNISSNHCRIAPETEAEALEKALDVNEGTIAVQYSVWIGETKELERTWRLKMRQNNSIYDVIETVARLDNRQKVEYSVVEGKPFVTSLGGLQDDPEIGTFWFVHLRTLNSDKQPELIELSPVDLKLRPNQEIILWYKPGPWNSHPRMAESTKSS